MHANKGTKLSNSSNSKDASVSAATVSNVHRSPSEQMVLVHTAHSSQNAPDCTSGGFDQMALLQIGGIKAPYHFSPLSSTFQFPSNLTFLPPNFTSVTTIVFIFMIEKSNIHSSAEEELCWRYLWHYFFTVRASQDSSWVVSVLIHDPSLCFSPISHLDLTSASPLAGSEDGNFYLAENSLPSH